MKKFLYLLTLVFALFSTTNVIAEEQSFEVDVGTHDLILVQGIESATLDYDVSAVSTPAKHCNGTVATLTMHASTCIEDDVGWLQNNKYSYTTHNPDKHLHRNDLVKHQDTRFLVPKQPYIRKL